MCRLCACRRHAYVCDSPAHMPRSAPFLHSCGVRRRGAHHLLRRGVRPGYGHAVRHRPCPVRRAVCAAAREEGCCKVRSAGACARFCHGCGLRPRVPAPNGGSAVSRHFLGRCGCVRVCAHVRRASVFGCACRTCLRRRVPVYKRLCRGVCCICGMRSAGQAFACEDRRRSARPGRRASHRLYRAAERQLCARCRHAARQRARFFKHCVRARVRAYTHGSGFPTCAAAAITSAYGYSSYR